MGFFAVYVSGCDACNYWYIVCLTSVNKSWALLTDVPKLQGLFVFGCVVKTKTVVVKSQI